MEVGERLNDGRQEDAAPTSAGAMLSPVSDDFWMRCMSLRPKLASYLRAILRDGHAVDDCLQETFIVLSQRYAGATGEDLSALAFTCARNKAHSWLDKNKADRLSIIDPGVLGKIAETAARLEEAEPVEYSTRVTALRECLDRLSPEQRELVEARYGGERGTSILALADDKGRKLDALYKQLERLRTLLKRCVSEKMTRPE